MKTVSSAAEKATLSYKVVAGHNPQDRSKTVLRGVIVNKETYDTARVLHFAIDNGYIQGGQFFACYGVVNGFFEACQRLGLDGRDILLNGWIRIHPEMKGRIDAETRTIGGDNEIHVCAQCQKDLRRKAKEFNWTCVDETGKRANVQHLQSVGGANDKEIFAGAKIAVGGTNLAYDAASDRITVEWDVSDEEGETTHNSVQVAPESSGYSAMVLPFPVGLDSASEGTVVTFTFLLRQGNAETTVIPAVVKAKLVVAPAA